MGRSGYARTPPRFGGQITPAASINCRYLPELRLGAVSAPYALPSGRSKVDGWRIAEVALLRDLSACPFAEIGSRVGISAPHGARLYERHRRFLDEAAYAERLAELTGRILAVGHVDGKR